MGSTSNILRELSAAILDERRAAMREIMRLRNSDVEGVMVRDVIEWLALPADRSSETAIGTILAGMGYVRFRRTNPETKVREYRLFPATSAPKGWRKQ